MATIQELVDQQEDWKPGTLKLRNNGEEDRKYFMPYFLDSEGEWVGVDEHRETTAFNENSTGWEVYTEPKKKVKYYQWIDKNSKQIVDIMYTEEGIANHNLSNYVKIPGSVVELEEQS